jgi:endoglucanase
MIPSLRDASLLFVATVAFGTGACSSSTDATQSIPTAGKGGTGGSGAMTGGSGGTSAAVGGSAGTSSGTGGGIGEGGSAAGGDLGPELPWLHVEGNTIKDASGNTVVLRGVDLIDLAATEQWEGGIDKMIDRLTDPNDAQGSSPGWATKILRLAVVPADSGNGTPVGYQPGIKYYERYLRPTVDYARKKGLYVIIDWHYIDTTTLHQQTTTDFWTDIAPHFVSDSNVFFELFNEPTNGGSWATTKTDMQSWYDLVRAQGATDNLVFVGTPNWSQLVADAANDPLDGTNIVYVAHMYPQHWQQQSLKDQITTASKLVPVFMTEWGFWTSPMDPLLNGTITSYGAPFRQFVEERNLSWSAWCASSSWAPPMFNKDYTLRVGEGEMGGFVKDWLYDRRNDDLPAP